jgi:hypothetical protein
MSIHTFRLFEGNKLIFNKKQKKTIFICLFCLIFIIVSFRLVSHVTFQSVNPVIAGFGLVKIYIFSAEYVIVKKEPQIIFTKPKDSENRLVKYMNDQEFKMMDKMGATVFFENNISEKQLISINTNKYCSRWVWD